MRIINHLWICFVFVMLFNGCRQDSKSKETNCKILVSVKEKDLTIKCKFDDIIEDIDYVSLETTDESIIGQVSKVKFFKDYMIILDNQSRSIFIFDIKGKYINKISRVGSGPYEYTNINDFCIHPKTGDITILTKERKMLTFSLDLKRCTLTDNLPTFFIGIERFKNGNFAFTSIKEEAIVYVTDSNMNILHKGFAIPNRNTTLIRNSFSKYGDTVLCRLPVCNNDTIYRITEDSFQPWFSPDFEVHADYLNVDKYFVDDPKFGRHFSNPEMSYSGPGIYFETNKFILFPITYPRKYKSGIVSYVLFSKRNGKVRVLNYAGILNKPASMYIPLTALGEYSGKLVSTVLASDILNCQIMNECSITLRIKQLKEQLNEESNPVIAFVKFKE